MPHMRVEVAIGALGQAEWPMHIGRETGIRGRMRRDRLTLGDGGWRVHWGSLRQAAARSWKARARCDSASEPSSGTPCFSSEDISPKVLVRPSGLKIGS